MVVFNSGYWHELDRKYEEIRAVTRKKKPDDNLSKPLLKIDEIGTSVAEGKQLGGRLGQTVTAAISRGASQIELSMSPSGIEAGPASYTEEEKRELRDMAKINQVRFTSTHVSPGAVGNLSGLGQRGFSEQDRQKQINQIKEAIDFAADTALGGAVVVHTAEYPRSISRDFSDEGFTEFAGPEGKKERVHHMVDRKTGDVTKTVKEDQVTIGFWYKKPDGTETNNRAEAAEDEYGNPQIATYTSGTKEGQYKTYKKGWQEYEQEAQQLTEQGREIAPEELFFKDSVQSEIDRAMSQAEEYQARYNIHKRGADQVQERIDTIRQQAAQAESEEQRRRFQDLLRKQETQLLDEKRQMRAAFHSAQANQKQAEELEVKRENVVPIRKYALSKSQESLAILGIQAMKSTNNAKQVHKGYDVHDIFIAPENIWPEMGFGSHPRELIELVDNSRKKMTKMLVEGGYDKDEASQLAKRHIKATFDTEHLGMWKQHFRHKVGESAEERDKKFKEWYLKQVDELGKSGILGHIHMADSFGSGHANLPPGVGELPIKDAVKHLQEKGYKGTLISEGYGDPTRQETAAWAYFSSPIYAIGSEKEVGFDKIHEIHATAPVPYRTVTPPSYPSEEWKLWSEVPLD